MTVDSPGPSAAPGLSDSTLSGLRELDGVRTPAYDRGSVTAGVVHLGLGAFARAHVARYCDDLLALGQGWGDGSSDGVGDPAVGITGVSLRSGSTTRALAPQDGLYTLLEVDGPARNLRVIGSVTGVAHGAAAAIDAIAAHATTTVTLTVTEKGYHHAAALGRLDLDDPSVAYDLAHPTDPRTAAGVLVAALGRRRAAGLGGLAVVSCDNLPANGAVTATVVTDLAAALDPDLADWIAAHVAFPSTVVDRIVPATTDADRWYVAGRLGVHDAAPVRAEPHCSWVIEDTPGLPAWHRVGATVVPDVTPWQERKLRTVNGPHSALAYLGALAGHVTIDAAVADPTLAAFVTALLADELAPTLSPAAGTRPTASPTAGAQPAGPPTAGAQPVGPPPVDAAATLARFANPALGHRTAQVAADGTQKLRQRIVDPMADQLAGGGSIDRLALVVAAWMAWVARCSTGAQPLEDPLASQLIATARAAGTRSADLVHALLATEAVFDPALAADPTVQTTITHAYSLLSHHGAVDAARGLT